MHQINLRLQTLRECNFSLFDDPTEDERILYAQYWQKKLSNNDSIDFPNSLVKDVAHKTEKFSFAYLKEAL